jgi:enterochelin esterase family protein
MRLLLTLSFALAAFAVLPANAQVDTKPPAPNEEQRKPGPYTLGPDSLEQPGVPKGQLVGPLLFKSRVIAGTVRRYWVYVPAQYSKDRPANVLVFQDGQRATNPTGPLRVQQVLENLIHKKEIPVTIGIFITPGQRGDTYPEDLGTGNPNNRAAEYDSLDDTYARFLVDEMLPEVGQSYALTTDPARRAIGGTSSGAICAFTVAWHRPDQFRNVISMIGSYTSIAYRPATDGKPLVPGGDLYPTLIRKNPIKPLRVFLQDGSNDLDNIHGNWFFANQQMLAAFAFANAAADTAKDSGPRYSVRHVWGEGGHSDVHGGSMLPDILRWIWSDSAK